MWKRGQITIFIIIAIFLIAAIILFFVFRDSIKIGGIPKDIEPIYNDFSTCLEDSSYQGLREIALHGGYYNVPFESSIIYFDGTIPYYYLDSRDYVPSINTIEKEIAEYISENLKNCFYLEEYKTQGFRISVGDFSTSAKINEKNTKITMIDTLAIRKEGDTELFKNIELKIDYNIKKLHEVSKKIVESYSKKPGAICLTCLEELSEDYNVNIEATPINDVSVFENNIIWFTITDKEDLSSEKLKWVFIVEQ